MGFSRQESWNGLPFPSPGDLSLQELNPGVRHLRWILYRLSYKGIPLKEELLGNMREGGEKHVDEMPGSRVSA